MSLQTGSRIAITTDAIIDPKDLSIPACYVEGPGLESSPSVLFMNDIREAGELGFIIDDSSKLMPLDGLVRLQAVIDSGFHIASLPVIDRSKHRLGTVEDYSFDSESSLIQQLHIKPPFLRSLMHGSHIIGRRQIIDVSSERIVVDSPDVRAPTEQTDEATSFVNPFRSPETETR